MNVLIVDGMRTAMAEYAGTPGFGKLASLSAIELAVHAAKAAFQRAGVDPTWIDHVIVGNALQTSKDAIYGARHVGIKAGVPIEAPALTVNRLCGSGFESIIQAAHRILLDEARFVLAGGMESMSQAPHTVRGLRGPGLRFGQKPELEDLLFESLLDPIPGLYMAQTAELLAKRYEVSREDQDAFALRSHQLGVAATDRGVFQDEIAPITVRQRRKEVEVALDDHIKRDTSAEALAKLRPAFGKDGTVTAGNASGIVDGAACCIVAREDAARDRGLSPIARLVSWGTAGCDPEVMGIGPAPAIRIALKKAELSLDDLDLIEINEAFAAQYLAVERELGLDRDKVNVNGGAIALGHPLGMTGTRLTLTLARELQRREARYGVASACIGGGQGIAVVLERI